MLTCVQFLAHGWKLWEHLGPGWWWTSERVHLGDPWGPWNRFVCSPWMYASGAHIVPGGAPAIRPTI